MNRFRERVATAGLQKGGGIKVWNATTGDLVFEFARGRDFKAVAFSNDGDYLIAGDCTGMCNIMDAKGWHQLQQFNAHHGEIPDIAMNPKAMTFLTAGADGAIHCWSLLDAKKIATYLGHEGPVNSVAWEPNGQNFVSSSFDDTVKVWPVSGNATVRKLKEDVLNSDGNSLKASAFGSTTKSESSIFLDLQSEKNELDALREALIQDNTAPVDEAIEAYIDLAAKRLAPRPMSLRRVLASDQAALLIAVVWSHDLSKLITVRPGGKRLIFDLWNVNEHSKTHLRTSTAHCTAKNNSGISRVVREQVGETIGPYKLLEKLGEGGMGIVYPRETLAIGTPDSSIIPCRPNIDRANERSVLGIPDACGPPSSNRCNLGTIRAPIHIVVAFCKKCQGYSVESNGSS